MHVQNQAAWPTGNRAKFSHGPRDNRDAGFNFDPQVIAVAKEMFLHRLNCFNYICWHVWLSLLKFLQLYPDASRQDINRATPYQPCFATRLGGVSGGKGNPRVACLLPYSDIRGRKTRISKIADSNGDESRKAFVLPEDG